MVRRRAGSSAPSILDALKLGVSAGVVGAGTPRYSWVVLHALSTIWAACWLFLSTPVDDMVSLTAVAAIAVLAAVLAARALLLAAAAVSGTAYGPVGEVVISSGRAYRVPRLWDPDAAGRPRPRAPAAGLAA